MWYHDMFGEINLSLSDAPKPKTIRKLAKYNNMLAWQMWFRILVQCALHRYKFENLPPTINERVLKLSLLWHGSVCIFQYQGHAMALPGAAGTSGVTVYGDYTNSWVYGRNGWNKQIRLWLKGEAEIPMLAEAYANLPEDQKPSGVWFRENEMKAPFIDVCIQFADAISDTWRKLENARLLTSKGFVVVGEEAEAQTALKLFKDYADNVPFIYLTRKIEEQQKDVIPLNNNTDLIKSQTDHLIWLLSTFYRLCGKRSMENPDKLSGMGPSEISAGDEVIYASVDNLCDYMQENGLDLWNEHSGDDIRVVPEGRMDYADDALQGLDQNAGPRALEQSGSDLG